MSEDKRQSGESPVHDGLQDYFDQLLGVTGGLNMVGGTDFVEEAVKPESPLAKPGVVTRPAPAVRKYLDANRPHWAQQQFDAILIRSRSHQFAIPLNDLLSVGLLPATQLARLQLTGAISIQSDGDSGPAYIAHIAKFLLLDSYQRDEPEQLNYLLQLKGSDWGLAVADVSDRLRIDPDAVHWQVDRGNRPWLAGNLFESHYPLLDLRQLLPVLARLVPRP